MDSRYILRVEAKKAQIAGKLEEIIIQKQLNIIKEKQLSRQRHWASIASEVSKTIEQTRKDTNRFHQWQKLMSELSSVKQRVTDIEQKIIMVEDSIKNALSEQRTSVQLMTKYKNLSKEAMRDQLRLETLRFDQQAATR